MNHKKLFRYSVICALLSVLLFTVSCKKKDKFIPLEELSGDYSEVWTMQDIADDMEYAEDELPPVDQPTQLVNDNTQRPQTSQGNTSSGTRQPEHGDFTVQFMSSRDFNRVEDLRRRLDNAAYFSEVIPVDMNGETWYRLRLRGSFSRSYADYLARQIKDQFSEISEYWVTSK